MCAVGLRRKPKRSASRSIRASRRPRCFTGANGEVRGVATGDMGVGKDGHHKDGFTRGMELHAKYTLFAEGARGSLSKQLIAKFDLARDSEPQKIRPRPEGAVEGRARKAPAGPRAAHVRLAARQFDRRRLVPVSPRGPAGGRRLRGAPELPEPLHRAVRGIPALQGSTADSLHLRGGQTHLIRCARDHRRRLAVGAEAHLPGRRADRLRGRLHQPPADQGFAQRNPLGNDGSRAGRGRRDGGPQRATNSPATTMRGAPPTSGTTCTRCATSSRSGRSSAPRSALRSPARHVDQHARLLAVRYAQAWQTGFRDAKARRPTSSRSPTPSPTAS